MLHPLAGVRVLDFTRMFAGPFATRILRELGADVIKIEPPVDGDYLRNGDVQGASGWFSYWNYGKRSVSIDLKTARGVRLCCDLARECDVLVENFRPGTLERLGLGADDLNAVNPRLVYCSLSGFGATSPEPNRPFVASIADAISGIMYMVGHDDDPPLHPGVPFADPILGLHAVIAIFGALFDRERTGRSHGIDVAMLDSLVWLMGPLAERNSQGEDIDRASRQGTRHRTVVPTGTFQGRDGWLEISGGGNEGMWHRLAEAIGHPELAERDHAWRVQNQAEVYKVLADWVSAQSSVADAERYLLEHGTMCARINSLSEMVRLPTLRQRASIQATVHRDNGPMDVTVSPFHFNGDNPEWVGPAPRLGEHNAQVLGEVLGLDSETVAELERQGILYRATI